MNPDPNLASVTWIELGVFATILTGIVGAIIAYLSGWLKELKKENDIVKAALNETRLELTKRLDEVRLETARNYATMETVAQVEMRLTTTVNKMASEIGQSLNHMTGRIESLFGQMLQNAGK
jgi:hypothetical protein